MLTIAKRVWRVVPIIIGTLLIFLFLCSPSLSFAQNPIGITVHYIEANPIEGKTQYQVKVFLSVLDGSGQPIKDLQPSDFTLTEDSKELTVDSVAPVEAITSNLVLAIDTSGSMSIPIQAARQAATTFLNRLGANDEVALFTFNGDVTQLGDFTSDHQLTSDEIAQANIQTNTGTCLYDAAYQSVELASTRPAGRRAIILLTDGVDESYPGPKPCSTHTIDDVISLASKEGSSVPIYTLGLGTKIDEASLKRLAMMTGGLYLYSPDATKLGDLFNGLYNQLKSEYELDYKSTNPPGPHSLTIEVNYRGAVSRDARKFLLPNLPTTLTISSPADKATISEKTKIVALLLTQGEPVSRVVCTANGVTIGEDLSTPYEFDFDPGKFPPGDLTIEVVAFNSSGAEIGKSSITVTLPETVQANGPAIPGITETVTPNQSPSPTPASGTTSLFSNPAILYGGIALLGLIIVVAVLLIVKAQRKHAQEPAKDEFGPRKQPSESDGKTMDGIDMSGIGQPGAVIGRLKILHSDDPMMDGQVLTISKSGTTIGRSPDNDVVMSKKDQPVSRHHAVIEARSNGIFLREVVSQEPDGSLKRPTYGTFVNNQRVEDECELRDGDEIRLGTRASLRFERVVMNDLNIDSTLDGFGTQNLDNSTQEMR